MSDGQWYGIVWYV